MKDLMPKNNLIVWEKWVDPFHEVSSMEEEELETIETDEDQILPPNHMMPMKAIITPIGLMPIDSLSTSEIFNFWIGHSNFSITKDIASIIEQSDGVEVLDIITRYRFRVGIGKIFTDRDVMKKINDNVYEYIDKYYD
jgi:hypothetical protein